MPYKNGYERHITFNDALHIGIMKLLDQIANKKFPFNSSGFDAIRKRVKTASEKALLTILNTQIQVKGGIKTVWCAQHDRDTLLPTQARSYELASFSGGESKDIFEYLMDLPEHKVTKDVEKAVRGAAHWFELFAHKGYLNPYDSDNYFCDEKGEKKEGEDKKHHRCYD